MRIIDYLNPIAHLGERRYPLLLSFLVNLSVCLLSEIYCYKIVKDPLAVGAYIIFINGVLIIYFAFRSGVAGGMIATIITILYYLYIIYTRHYHGTQLYSGIVTTAILAVLYAAIAFIIGWLRQIIDSLIEREANEKNRLQTMVQQLPVGVVITDKHGSVEMTNKQLESILGMKVPRGVMAGSDMLLNIKQQDKQRSASQSPVEQALVSGKAIRDKEFTIERPDKKLAHVRINVAPIRGRKGDMIAAAAIIDDITQKKEMENRKDDFVNIASHELKTPLTSLKLYLESLRRRVQSDEQAKKILLRITDQTDKLQELVNDLLDVSRIQTGKLHFTKERFSLSELIEETIEGMQEAASNHTIAYSRTGKLDIYADRFRIYQVLTNLLTNALKYSPAGSTIKIVAKQEKQKVVVSVKDEGIGIAQEEQKKIFDRLYQVTDLKDKAFPGLGIGLYISREIIRRHRGAIWVESEKGKGSTFYFSLPRQKVSER